MKVVPSVERLGEESLPVIPQMPLVTLPGRIKAKASLLECERKEHSECETGHTDTERGPGAFSRRMRAGPQKHTKMTSSTRVFKHGEHNLFTATLRIFILGISKCFMCEDLQPAFSVLPSKTTDVPWGIGRSYTRGDRICLQGERENLSKNSQLHPVPTAIASPFP